MDIRDIEYFVCIWDSHGFSNAAEILHISQPALSQCIRKMENKYKITLFKRNVKKLELTPEGEILYKEGKILLTFKNRMIQQITNLSHQKVISLRIGISPFYSKYYIPKLFSELSKVFPKLTYKIVEDISVNLEQKLQDGELDICFVPLEPRNPVLNYQILCIEEIFLAVPAKYNVNIQPIPGKELSYIDLEQVKNLPFVSLKKIQKITSLTDRLCKQAGFEPHIVYETLDWDTVNIMIANGIGVGFVPDILCSKQITQKQPCYYRIANIPAFRHYAAAWQKGRKLSEMEQEIINIFKSDVSQLHMIN